MVVKLYLEALMSFLVYLSASGELVSRLQLLLEQARCHFHSYKSSFLELAVSLMSSLESGENLYKLSLSKFQTYHFLYFENVEYHYFMP